MRRKMAFGHALRCHRDAFVEHFLTGCRAEKIQLPLDFRAELRIALFNFLATNWIDIGR
jgi:hypothetical protein